MKEKMYEVCAKCGHVGKGYYVEKTFVVRADSAKEAAALVRQFPRVKHHHKDAIRRVMQINEARYREIIAMNAVDPYMLCKNAQEQRLVENIPLEEEENSEKSYEISKHLFNQKKRMARDRALRKEVKYAGRNLYYREYYS